MKYFENTTDFFCDGPSAVTLGKFDGLHRGHQKLIRKITELKKEGLEAVVFLLHRMSARICSLSGREAAEGGSIRDRCNDSLSVCSGDPEYGAGTVCIRDF